jgi:hypothetical protein
LHLKNKLELTILALSVYFLSLEIYRIGRNVRKYLSRPASLLDALPQILLIINICQKYNNEEDEITTRFWRIQAITALLLWFKMLYFLRSNASTSYFVRMLSEVCLAIYPFLVILTVMVFAFADAGYSLSSSL